MDLNEMNENWQNEAPKLAAMEKINPFTVPVGYFDNLTSELRSQIAIHTTDTQNTAFELPENYFNTLNDTLRSRIRLEELTANIPLEAYSVPENYFLTLGDKIKTKIEKSETKESKPVLKKLTTSWLGYAAAACITTAVAVGLYLNINTKNVNNQLTDIPATEIVEYLQLYSDAGDAPVIMENLGDKPALSELDPTVSDLEIKQYLESNL